MISELLAARAQPLLTTAIVTLMGDYAQVAAAVPADAAAQAAALQTAGRDIITLANALDVLQRRAAEND